VAAALTFFLFGEAFLLECGRNSSHRRRSTHADLVDFRRRFGANGGGFFGKPVRGISPAAGEITRDRTPSLFGLSVALGLQ
jgi:hypothetical protein